MGKSCESGGSELESSPLHGANADDERKTMHRKKGLQTGEGRGGYWKKSTGPSGARARGKGQQGRRIDGGGAAN